MQDMLGRKFCPAMWLVPEEICTALLTLGLNMAIWAGPNRRHGMQALALSAKQTQLQVCEAELRRLHATCTTLQFLFGDVADLIAVCVALLKRSLPAPAWIWHFRGVQIRRYRAR